MSDVKRTNFHCNSCGQRTWHSLAVLHEQEVPFWMEDGEEGPEYLDRYEVWICQGCESGLVRVLGYLQGDLGEEATYPPRRDQWISGKKFRKLPKALTSIYNEVIDTFNHGSRILCAAGLRALLEGVCNERRVAGRTLEDKITGLTRFVPGNIVENLHSFRFLGNIALHDLAPPSRDALALAIEVIEDLMNIIYELDYKTARLMQSLQQGKKAAPLQSGPSRAGPMPALSSSGREPGS